MPRVERHAEAVWHGSSARGSGVLSAGSSGAFGGLEYSEPSRIAAPDGQTSPEELLAAAHAACFSMSLAAELTRAKAPPERLSVRATTVLDEVPGAAGHRIVESIVTVRARAGVERGAFDEVVRAADEGCPFSNLIKASGTVTIDAKLDEGGTADGD
ncbi:MAG: OsmC family peroxiredoxin [Thermoleophilia bacterium]|nr:OsmC family peroxiredoxin [Thermoleophilia bacterium]